MFDMIIIPNYLLDYFRFNDIYNFCYGLIIIAIILGILFKSNSFYKKTHQKKMFFFMMMFFISIIFEFLHISNMFFHNTYIEFFNAFLNRFYQCIGLFGILFIRENLPEDKITYKDFIFPVGSFALMIFIEIFLAGLNLEHTSFPSLFNSLTIFAYISALSGFIFVRLSQKKSPFTLFYLGIIFLAASSLYFINEPYYSSWYRHLIHFFRILGNLFVFLDLSQINEDLHKYRFRLKLILLPNLYMILFFITFVLFGNYIFALNFTQEIYIAFIFFYCLCLIAQFVFVLGVTSPLTQISQILMSFKPGEKPHFLNINTNDEVETLAQNINKVYEKEWKYTKEINEKQEQIKELMSSRDTFIASLSHDLKSPIFSEQKIIEFILMDRDAIKISDFIEYIEEMYKINDEVLRIVDNILTGYHLDSEKFELELVPANVNSIIKGAAKTLKQLAKDENIEISLELDSQIPLVNIDEDMVRRVIVNLASNAIKHSRNSKELKISTFRTASEIKISVQDFGKGIPKEDQKNIFQKYPTVKRKIGTGLGLYISKQIIDAHQGKIWFESEEEKGTTFFFTLPL